MRAWVVGLVVIAACEKKKAPEPTLEGPMPIRFGDCAAPNLAFVSGPRPAPFTAEQASGDWSKVAETEGAGAQVASEPPPPPAEPARPAPKPLTDEERRQAIEAARAAGVLSSTALVENGAFASLTGDMSGVQSGFDDTNIYGGLLGNEAGEMNGGFGFGRAGFGPGGGGTGWGTIGTGKYGTIGHGSGTGAGYGIGRGRGGMRSSRLRVPSTAIGQPTATGDLDKALIRRYIKRTIPKITYCYEKQLLAIPGLSGTVTAHFFITPNGEVATSSAEGMNPDVASCVAGVIKAIVFPKPKGGGGVQVNYPFTFRPAGDDTTTASGAGSDANAGSAGSDANAGSAAEAAAGSGAAEPVAPERKLFRPGDAPKAPATYEPGADNPLRGQTAEIEKCLRKGSARSGAAVFELAYAGGKTTGANVFGVGDTAVEKCLAEVAKRVAPPTGQTLQRCSIAFGEGTVDALPAVVITSDAILFGGPTLGTPEAAMKDEARGRIPALAEAVEQRVKATTSGKAPLTMHGPVAIKAVDATPMKVVVRAVASVLGGGDDFVLAAQAGGAWSLVDAVALPVVPVPFGTGARWGRIKVPSSAWGFGEPAEPKTVVSVLVTKEAITVGTSGASEFQTIARDAAAMQKLGDALAALQKSKDLASRTDIEIAAADDVTYADFVAVVKTAIAKGFRDWILAEPSTLAARPPQ